MTLNEVSVGASVRVDSLLGPLDPVLLRLMEMGVVPGSELHVRKRAPFGGPLELRVEGYLLSIRTSEAKRLSVKPAPYREVAKSSNLASAEPA